MNTIRWWSGGLQTESGDEDIPELISPPDTLTTGDTRSDKTEDQGDEQLMDNKIKQMK